MADHPFVECDDPANCTAYGEHFHRLQGIGAPLPGAPDLTKTVPPVFDREALGSLRRRLESPPGPRCKCGHRESEHADAGCDWRRFCGCALFTDEQANGSNEAGEPRV